MACGTGSIPGAPTSTTRFADPAAGDLALPLARPKENAMPEEMVMTVLGPVPARELGVTVTHEHCLIDGRHWFQESEELSRRRDMDKPIEMSMLGELRRRQMNVT